MKNNEINTFIDAYQHFSELGDKRNAKYLAEMAVKAFNSALLLEDPLKRFDTVNRIVNYMKSLTRYETSMSDFLLAKKKMINYSVLEQLSDPSKVSFTLQDCEVLSQRYRALHEVQ